jgi:hypothetical protein
MTSSLSDESSARALAEHEQRPRPDQALAYAELRDFRAERAQWPLERSRRTRTLPSGGRQRSQAVTSDHQRAERDAN